MKTKLLRLGGVLLLVSFILQPAAWNAHAGSSRAPAGEDADGNLIFNPSFEDFDQSGQLLGWHKGGFGDNDATLYLTEGTGGRGTVAGEVFIGSSYHDGDAKWYHDPVTVTPGQAYFFTNRYQSSRPSRILVQLSDDTGTSVQYVQIAAPDASPGTWASSRGTFTVPEGKTKAVVFHLIEGPGYLIVDDYFLASSRFARGMVTFRLDDAWLSQFKKARPILNDLGMRGSFAIVSGFIGQDTRMTPRQVRKIFQQGHEVMDHTEDHRDLVSEVPPSEWNEEIVNSRSVLEQVLRTEGVITTFVYPYGSYSPETNAFVRSVGYLAAVNSDGHFNDRGTDHFLLGSFAVDNGANGEHPTTPAQLEALVDQAEANGTWVILLFHQIEPIAGAQYAFTPQDFAAVAQYVATKNVDVVTVAEGVQRMFPQ